MLRISVRRSDGPTTSMAQRECVRRERGADERGVAAVGAAVDRDPVGVGVALLGDPGDGVEQVVVHARAPLAVAGVQEVLAVARRAAVVHLHAQVAAVGEPLRVGCEAPLVARPRAAVHEEHRRSARAVGARREREVAVHLQAVAGGEAERLHRRERVLRRGRACARRGTLAVPLRAVEGVVGHRPVVGGEADDPDPVGVVAAAEVQVAGMQRPHRLDVGGAAPRRARRGRPARA